MSGQALARAAEALVGRPYRLHGREPATGLDCVGVFAAALAAIGRRPNLPTGYALRNRRLPDLAEIANACGVTKVAGPVGSGDIVLFQVSACQAHLAIADNTGGFVHAHAGLRRVVRQNALPAWPNIGQWRLAELD